MLPHTFDLSKLSSPPPMMPPSPSVRPPELPKSPLPDFRRKAPPLRNTAQPASASKQASRSKSKLEELFKMNFGSGRYTRAKSSGGGILGGKYIESIEGNMERYMVTKAGRHLAKKMATGKKQGDLIAKKIEATLRRLPAHMSDEKQMRHIPARELHKLDAELYREMKKGNLDKINLKHAEEIVKDIEI